MQFPRRRSEPARLSTTAYIAETAIRVEKAEGVCAIPRGSYAPYFAGDRFVCSTTWMAKTEDAAIHPDISRRLVVLTQDVVPSTTGKVMPRHASREQKTHHGEQDDEDRRDSADLRRSPAFLEVGFSLCIHGIELRYKGIVS
jgi:hypothetical protein